MPERICVHVCAIKVPVQTSAELSASVTHLQHLLFTQSRLYDYVRIISLIFILPFWEINADDITHILSEEIRHCRVTLSYQMCPQVVFMMGFFCSLAVFPLCIPSLYLQEI